MSQRPRTYHLRDQTPVPVETHTWQCDAGTRAWSVAQTDITREIRLSTVFTGFDAAWRDDQPVLVFETMLLDQGTSIARWRWSTWEIAAQGHKNLLLLCNHLVQALSTP